MPNRKYGQVKDKNNKKYLLLEWYQCKIKIYLRINKKQGEKANEPAKP